MQINIPRQLNELMLSRGEAGKKWLQELPSSIEKLQQDWHIEIEAPFKNSYCNYVAQGKTKNGSDIVLKVSYPDQEFYREINYLKLQKDGPVPKVLQVDESIPAILLEKISPAQTLATIQEDEAIIIAASLMDRLWKKVDVSSDFRSLDELYQDFLRLKELSPMNTLFSADILKKAQDAYILLTQNPEEEFLLHGDLHQFNIIFDSVKGWIVIDPSGIIGEKAYEVATFLRNPPAIGSDPKLKEILKNRIYTFSRILDLNSKRIYLWGLFQTVLSSLWAVEDNADFLDSFVNVANALAEIEID